MADVVRDFIAAELALVVPAARTPAAAEGYGTDLEFGAAGLTPRLALVSGIALLGQDLAHRADTPKGALPDDPDYGIEGGIRSWLHRGRTQRDLLVMAAELSGEFRKDDRVAAVVVRVVPDGAGLGVTCSVTPESTGSREFQLVIALTSTDLIAEVIAA